MSCLLYGGSSVGADVTFVQQVGCDLRRQALLAVHGQLHQASSGQKRIQNAFVGSCVPDRCLCCVSGRRGADAQHIQLVEIERELTPCVHDRHQVRRIGHHAAIDQPLGVARLMGRKKCRCSRTGEQSVAQRDALAQILVAQPRAAEHPCTALAYRYGRHQQRRLQACQGLIEHAAALYIEQALQHVDEHLLLDPALLC